jgi:hypothetical protein
MTVIATTVIAVGTTAMAMARTMTSSNSYI